MKHKQPYSHIRSLDIVRGLAALAVFIAHFVQHFLPVNDLGWAARAFSLLGVIGVTIFFVLSGFLIHMGASIELAHRGNINWLQYGLRRLLRIYPAYLAAIMGYALLMPHIHSEFATEITTQGLITHLLLISSFFPTEFHSINGIFWTVIVECHFYLIYPFIFPLIRKLSPIRFFAIVWLVSNLFFIASSALTHAGENRMMLQMTAPALIWKWALGIVLAEICINNKLLALQRHLTNIWLAPPTLFLIFACTLTNYPTLELNYSRFITPFLCFIFLGIVIFSPLRNWHSKVGEWLGEVSYSVYLWHPLCLIIVTAWPLPTLPLNLCASVALTAAVSALSHRVIEKPSIRLGKSIASRLNQRRIQK
jgi:peptidoglycan/LPS O-acetylase OafA/YrhL